MKSHAVAAALVLTADAVAQPPAPTAPTPPTPVIAPAAPTAPAAKAERWAGAVELPGGMKLEITVSLTPPKGTIDIPLQSVTGAPLEDVSTEGGMLRFTLKPPGAPRQAHAVFEATVTGDTATGTLSQVGKTFPMTLRRVGEGETTKTYNRPQTPKPPFPYRTEDVAIENPKAAGVKLSATISIPAGDGPHAVAVVVSGSGAQDRDGTMMHHKPYLVIADHLARAGIACLRYDERGLGGSTGDLATATTDDFASDASAVVAYLKARPEFSKVGIIGHSEGGMVGPMVAAESPGDVDFLVLLGAPGLPGIDIIEMQTVRIAVAMGADEAKARASAAASREVLQMVIDGKPDADIRIRTRQLNDQALREDPAAAGLTEAQRAKKLDELVESSMAALNPWMRRFIGLDPRPSLRKTTAPVLALTGSLDLQVPAAANLAEIGKALREAGNTSVTTAEIPGLNHLFQNATTGTPEEYAEIEQTFDPATLDRIAAWIVQTARK